jgi:vacuolar-type H+-ATPase subunit E/Vma4
VIGLGVSVEDKIELFRNVVFREIEESVSAKKLKATEVFEQEKSRCIAEAESKRHHIIEEAVKKADKEKQQLIAKAKSQVYRKILDKKQQFIIELTEILMQKAGRFVAEEEYKGYLSKSLDKAGVIFEDSASVQLYFTKRDLEAFGEFIGTSISVGKLKGKCLLKEAEQNIIGGFYAEDGNEEMQVDYTLKSMIVENHELIGSYISRKFDEVQTDGY